MAEVRNITLEEIRPLLGNLSRANYYQVQFGGLSTGLSNFLASRDVSRNFVGSDVGLMCKSASLPGSSLGTVESGNFHGVTENFVYQKIFTEISLSFYCDDEYRGLKFLEHWMEYAVSGGNIRSGAYASPQYNYRLQYPNDPGTGYKSQATRIFKFENNYSQVMEYNFIGLMPKSLNSVPLRYGPNSELTEITCSFVYDRYVAGSIRSYDYVLGTSNNLLANAANFVNDLRIGDAVSIFNNLIN